MHAEPGTGRRIQALTNNFGLLEELWQQLIMRLLCLSSVGKRIDALDQVNVLIAATECDSSNKAASAVPQLDAEDLANWIREKVISNPTLGLMVSHHHDRCCP